jgi:hypothetical protein
MSGALRTPYHFMKTKEKRKLDGEVMVTNMYETIIPRDEFLLKDIDTQKMLMIRWRDLYSNGKIMEDMGITGSASFHKIIKDLEIPKKTKWDRKGSEESKPRKAKTKSVAVDPQPQTLFTEDIIQPYVQQQPTPIIIEGLHIQYNGEFDAEQLNKMFTKLQLLTDGEEGKYRVSISLTECKE